MARQRLSTPERETLALRRLMRNLEALGVANMRTLEMKVSDAGPEHLRVDPHILTRVRKAQFEAGRLKRADALWYYRQNEPAARVEQKLGLLRPLYAKANHHNVTMRLGQALEIAVLRALGQGPLPYVGGFLDLDAHGDDQLYKKEEPPLSFAGRRMPGSLRFDFLAFHPSAGPLGIEVKNVREWLYPDRSEVRELLHKATATDTVPVLIARRIPYVTFRLLGACGVLLFENFNQLYPAADAALVAEVRQKDLLGYHDVRAGNDPNPRLVDFITRTLPGAADAARARFVRYQDLLYDFGTGEISYPGFAARVRRRENGTSEHSDEPLPEDLDPNEFE